MLACCRRHAAEHLQGCPADREHTCLLSTLLHQRKQKTQLKSQKSGFGFIRNRILDNKGNFILVEFGI